MQTDLFGQADTKSAIISSCGAYRYSLTRTWCPNGKKITFVCLNPSTADAYVDDPTIRRCIAFSKSWGGGTIEMVNLFALRSTTPQKLYISNDPIGPENDHFIENAVKSSDLVVAAWGNHGSFRSRATEVLSLIGNECQALAITKSGMPGHPLYLSKSSVLMPYP